jgi:ABC-type multidrug transport system permease subunit
MHARPIRHHKFCQPNVAIAFYIGGIPTFSLGILLVVSYTYGFEVSVPIENFITAQFPMMQFTHDSLS